MPQTVLETLAVALLSFFTVGYFVLGGADLGLGMVLPYLGRGPYERRLVLDAVVPFFLGNEVWLIAAAGVFTGCFPAFEGELFQGQFMVLVPLLTGWMVRDTGLWWRRNGESAGRHIIADGLVTGGSWMVALSWGWLLAGLAGGTPEQPAGGPLVVLAVLAVAALFAAHGLAFGSLRLTGKPWERARRMTGRGGHGGRVGRSRPTLALTAVAMAALPLVAGARLPLAESAVTGPVLGLLVPALLVMTPLLVAAQVWMWQAFSGRSAVPGPS